MNTHTAPIAVIGGGAMARAILEGADNAGVLGGAWIVAEPDADRRGDFENAVATARAAVEWLLATEATPGEGQVLLAVKPQKMGEVGDEIGAALAAGPSRVVVSILAGTPSARVRTSMGGGVRVVRAMPNLPAQLGRGMTAVCIGDGGGDGDDARARELFEGVGRVIEIPESLMDAYTALAGSGPAYVFYLAEAMIHTAVELGFTREEATLIVRETVAGAGEMLAASPEHPGTLRAGVTSKGGTTAAACESLDQSGVMDAFDRAIRAARSRGVELAGG